MNSKISSDSEIISQCEEERANWGRKAKNGSSPCFELLRRGFVEWRSESFEAVDRFYRQEFVSWVYNHPKFDLLCAWKPYLTPDDIVQKAYIKLHNALKDRDDFYDRFTSIAMFLAYCKSTIANLIIDELPRPSRTRGSVDNDQQTDENTPSSSQSIGPDVSPRDDDNTRASHWHESKDLEIDYDWKATLDHCYSMCNASEKLIFDCKVFDAPSVEELCETTELTRMEVNRQWRNIRARLRRDPVLGEMLGL